MIDVEKKLLFKKVKVRPPRYVIASLNTVFTGFWSLNWKEIPKYYLKNIEGNHKYLPVFSSVFKTKYLQAPRLAFFIEIDTLE